MLTAEIQAGEPFALVELFTSTGLIELSPGRQVARRDRRFGTARIRAFFSCGLLESTRLERPI